VTVQNFRKAEFLLQKIAGFPSIMASEPAPKHHIPSTEFVNIEYPGKVQNHERAFENLGGIDLLEKVRLTLQHLVSTSNLSAAEFC
jgi:hypothetical protein